MNNRKIELGIQSYCFRGFKKTPLVIEKLHECGVSHIEICKAHADFMDVSSFPSIIETYKNSGVSIASIGVERLGHEEALVRPLFEFLKLAGAGYMSVDFNPQTSPQSWRLAEKLADEYDVFLGIHNHGGRHWLGSAQMIEHVLASTSDRIGLCLDTAWALDSREDPIAMAERFADRLYGVHIKDFVFARSRQPEDVVVGEGNLDLEKLIGLIHSNDKVGYAILEYEGDVENPVPAIKACVEKVLAMWPR